MNRRRWQGIALAALFAALVVSGCQKSKKEGDTKADEQAKDTSAKDADKKKPHDHSEWWCDEHGIPEKECSKCQDDVAQAAKKRGDWCEKHEIAKSQCFKCNPKLREKYAARYRAKYNGKEPPEPTDN